MQSLSFSYPVWFILFCALLGAGYATLLYYKDRSFLEQSPWLNKILGAARFLTVTLLSMLLLSPILKSIVAETKKPIVVLAQDQSQSIGVALGTNVEAYKQSYNDLKNSLSTDYEVKEYAFGEKVREQADFKLEDKQTNLSDMMKSVYDLYSNQNLGAVILASDGIYNEGSNPLYAAPKLAAPVYAIALGDTTKKRDLLIKRAFNNKIAYLGDKFNIQLDVVAQNCLGAATTLTTYKVEGNNATKLQQVSLNINKTDYFNTQDILLNADRAGVQHFRVVLSQVGGEANASNNSKDIFIEVIDARQKILLLANSPHPDLAAFHQGIGENKNYKITVAYIQEAKVNVADYDFVILHQLPSKTNDIAGILKVMNDRKIPRLFVVGTQSELNTLNNVQNLLTIRGDGKNTNEVQAIVAPNFTSFTLDEKIKKDLPNFAPVVAPFGEFKETGNGQVLLYQRIGKVDTKYPLWIYGEQNNIKVGVLAAEGLWKWRMFDFLQHKNHDITDELIAKSVQYLSIKDDKRKFRISTPKNLFNENEPITFDAELYNDNYELVNDPDVALTITNSENKEFNYTFNKSGRTYNLNAGQLPQGFYNYKGATNFNGQALMYSGQFSVQALQLEAYETTADHGLLRTLTQKYGGDMVYADKIATLPDLLKAKGAAKAIIYQTNKTRSVINLKWIFWLLLTLLAGEWFARRYFGSY